MTRFGGASVEDHTIAPIFEHIEQFLGIQILEERRILLHYNGF
jgi:hypothetical protein